MSTRFDTLELTAYDADFISLSAAMFGFSPTRPEWYRYQFETNAEQLRGNVEYRDPRASMDAPVGFGTGWYGIGLVPSDESRDMAEALRRAYSWYKGHPNVVPDWYDPYPKWDWRVIREMIGDPGYIDLLAAAAEFMDQGSFVNTIQQEPEYRIILTRSYDKGVG